MQFRPRALLHSALILRIWLMCNGWAFLIATGVVSYCLKCQSLPLVQRPCHIGHHGRCKLLFLIPILLTHCLTRCLSLLCKASLLIEATPECENPLGRWLALFCNFLRILKCFPWFFLTSYFYFKISSHSSKYSQNT